MHKILICSLAVILSCSIGFGAEVTSKNNSKVREFYANFPGSDADRNGVLSLTEMRTFIMKKVRSSATSENYPPLKRLLRRAPKADLNRDGVLTKTELIKYLR